MYLGLFQLYCFALFVIFFFAGWGLPLYIACVSSNVYLSLLSSVATGRTTMLDKKSNFKFLIVLASSLCFLPSPGSNFLLFSGRKATNEISTICRGYSCLLSISINIYLYVFDSFSLTSYDVARLVTPPGSPFELLSWEQVYFGITGREASLHSFPL